MDFNCSLWYSYNTIITNHKAGCGFVLIGPFVLFQAILTSTEKLLPWKHQHIDCFVIITAFMLTDLQLWSIQFILNYFFLNKSQCSKFFKVIESDCFLFATEQIKPHFTAPCGPAELWGLPYTVYNTHHHPWCLTRQLILDLASLRYRYTECKLFVSPESDL